MSAVYIVLSVQDLNAHVEVYASSISALGRARALAHYKSIMNRDLVEMNPEESKMPDGSSKWIFVDTNKCLIAVIYSHILISNTATDPMDGLKDLKPEDTKTWDPLANLQTVLPPPVTPTILAVPSYDDPYADTLPGGWSHAGKPITMKQMWDSPADTKLYYNLTDAQKWALALARVQKRDNFYLYLPGIGTMNQAEALSHLKSKNAIGEEIRDDEMIWLQAILEDRLEATKDGVDIEEDDSSDSDSWT